MELAVLSEIEPAIFHVEHHRLITSESCQGEHFEEGVVAGDSRKFPGPAHFFFHRGPEALEDFWVRRDDGFFSIILSMHMAIEFVEHDGNRNPVALPDLMSVS